MSLKNKLNRMKKHIVREEPEKGKDTAFKSDITSTDLPFKEIWKEHGTTMYFVDDDFCLVREKRYPLQYQHGKYKFQDLLKAVDAWQNFSGTHPLSCKGLSPGDLFFFDTETTGLGGGVGNTIFLLGHGRVEGDEVVVTQHFLPRPGSEIPLYHSFLKTVDYNALVTYNGKAFDWPQVRTRHTLIKEHVPKLPSFGHFDLYHGSRRLFKHKMESVKLINVERKVLGFERVDDVPGYLAPMIYFDFIERKDPQGILRVMEHNELDILSLISLYTHLTFQLLEVSEDSTEQETFEAGRWLEYTGNADMAKERFEHIVNDREETHHDSIHHLAFHYKKEKDFDKAASLWEGIVRKCPLRMKAVVLEELAKIYEHKHRDYVSALKKCRELETVLNEFCKDEGVKEKRLQKLYTRINRITLKADRKNLS
ncbi:ribonuclease H-like domain-containing protein [Rossellomorea oryzaecorticis]|uniref:Ribonuclease H-like domain-containing protein n=1 Tax=Rossellomorea oryzaecorticis TaxID=1396505 RepID=A0ABW8VNR3_9BACI|nr:ribonuclease H-like domain-containing protein [[Bacillus] enclensis]QTC43278.1 ribonuclease H-like domain-containing protein [Bacillus sp. V3]QWC21445.1 ribonuclease H-like domain-containing protein [Bacillus haikouensis]